MIAYTSAKQRFPDLPAEEGKHLIVFLGYESCPYSAKTLDLIGRIGLSKEQFHFEVVARSEGASVKKTLGNSSFPIVFVRAQSGKLIHIGGADELEHVLAGAERSWIA